MRLKIALALFVTTLLAGCYGVEKAPKDCTEFAHQERCERKDHCAWGDDTGCVAK